MLYQILGMVLSGIISLIIAHFYYKKASKDLRIEAETLRKLNNDLKALINDLSELDQQIIEDTDTIRKIVIKNTPSDPDYPYK